MCVKKKIIFSVFIKNFKNNDVKNLYFKFYIKIIRNFQIKIHKYFYVENFYRYFISIFFYLNLK